MEVYIRDAEEKDIEIIFSLLKSYALQGIILERDREDISNNLPTFIVAEINGSLKGVVTFYDYGENLKEIRSLAVDSRFQGMAHIMQYINTKSIDRYKVKNVDGKFYLVIQDVKTIEGAYNLISKMKKS